MKERLALPVSHMRWTPENRGINGGCQPRPKETVKLKAICTTTSAKSMTCVGKCVFGRGARHIATWRDWKPFYGGISREIDAVLS